MERIRYVNRGIIESRAETRLKSPGELAGFDWMRDVGAW